MGRFSNLDFNDTPKTPQAPAAQAREAWPDMDAPECLRQGDERFWTGYYEEALTLYSRALRFNRELEGAWLGQIRCLLRLGEYPEAVTWSDRALERFRDSSDLLACKGLALTRAGDPLHGNEYLDGAVERRSPSAWVWMARGSSLLLTNQSLQNAQRCFLKALEIAPDDWHVALEIGMAYNEAKRFAQARDVLLGALRPRPGAIASISSPASENPLMLLHLGLAREGLGEREIARGCFERALRVRPRFPEATNALGRVQGGSPLTKWWRDKGTKEK